MKHSSGIKTLSVRFSQTGVMGLECQLQADGKARMSVSDDTGHKVFDFHLGEKASHQIFQRASELKNSEDFSLMTEEEETKLSRNIDPTIMIKRVLRLDNQILVSNSASPPDKSADLVDEIVNLCRSLADY